MNYAEVVIKVLQGRGGFDGWWDQLDEEIQQDVMQEIQSTLCETTEDEPQTALFICKECFDPRIHSITSESYPGTCSVCGKTRLVVSCDRIEPEEYFPEPQEPDDYCYEYDYDFTADDRNFDMHNGR